MGGVYPAAGKTGAAEGRGYIASRTRSPQETTIATTRALRATPLQKWLRGERRLCMGFSPRPRGEPGELVIHGHVKLSEHVAQE